MLFGILIHIDPGHSSFGTFPDPHLQLLFITQVEVVFFVSVVFEEVCHHGAKGTDDHTGFTGDAKIGGPGNNSLVIFIQRIGRADTYTGCVRTLPAGKFKYGKFTNAF